MQFSSCSCGPVIPRAKYSRNFMPIRTPINKEMSHKLQILKAWGLQWLCSSDRLSSSGPDSSLANFAISSTCLPVLNCFRYRLQVFVHGDVRTLRTFSLGYSFTDLFFTYWSLQNFSTVLMFWRVPSAACELCKYNSEVQSIFHKKWSQLAKTLIKRSKPKLKTEEQTYRASRRIKIVETSW